MNRFESFTPMVGTMMQGSGDLLPVYLSLSRLDHASIEPVRVPHRPVKADLPNEKEAGPQRRSA
jgi:hypothetical protein